MTNYQKLIEDNAVDAFDYAERIFDFIDEKYETMEDFALVDELSKIANVKVPNAIEEIRTAPVLHKKECEVDEMPMVVKEFLGV